MAKIVTVRETDNAPFTLYKHVTGADGKPGLHLDFHPGQVRAWNSQRRFVMVISGTQGGKTAFGPWWVAREIEMKGGGDYIAATSTYDLFQLKMLPEMQNVYENILGIGRYWASSKVMEIADPETGKFGANHAHQTEKMWARIILRSAAAKGGLESATAKAAWLDELGQDEFTLGAWEAVRRRLSLHRGRVLGTTTPYNLGWLKQIMYDRWKAGAADIDVIQFASNVNPAFPQEEFDEVQETMQEWKFNMFYKGEFTRPAGMIYKDFIDRYRERGGHKVKPFVIPTTWPIVIGVDPGAVNLALIWLAHDLQTDTWYQFRESHGGEKSTGEHVADAKEIIRENKYHVIGWYIGAKGETQQRMDWEAAGAYPAYEPPVADVEAGIDRVIAMFRQHRLLIFDDCTGTLDQIGRYRRVLDEMGEPTEKIKDKDTFHYLDGLRYGSAGASEPEGIGYR